MNSRERVIKTLTHQPVDRAPRDLWTTPYMPMYNKDELKKLMDQYEWDLGSPTYRYGASLRKKGVEGEVGSYTDNWGCVWQVGEPGVVGEIKEPLLADWSSLATYKPPFELLDNADLSQVGKFCEDNRKSDKGKFMMAYTETRPFERAQFLRGTENVFLDLAYGTPEMKKLLDMIHDFFCREMKMMAATDVDGVQFMDDWGSQQALLISPKTWRAVFKPMYQDYCRILKDKKKFIFFHSDGNIRAIYPDLIEMGVDAVNSQLFCMDIEELGASFGGQVTFWGEIDRQHTLPFGKVEDVRAAVRRVRRALDQGQGGVFAQCSWEKGTPLENVKAVYDTWLEPRA